MRKAILVLLMLVGVTLLSCDSTEVEAVGHVKIIVLDPSDNPIPGATVVLSKLPGVIVAIGLTNGYGMFTYDHPYLYSEIMQVSVQTSDSLYHAEGIVRAIPDTTVELALRVY